MVQGVAKAEGWRGWIREGKATWTAVCAAPTFGETWRILLAWPTSATRVERVAMPAGRVPKEKR